MSLAKTDKGREALQRRELGLGPRERQIIIMANGKLSREAMAQLMRHDIHAELERLILGGYLVEEAVNTVVTAPVFALGAPPATPTPPQAGSRRSLAGTKMYIVDMLQRMRDMDSSAMAVTIHTSADEMEFIDNVVVAVRLIVRKSGSSYGTRVIDKLQEIVPVVYLPALVALSLDSENETK